MKKEDTKEKIIKYIEEKLTRRSANIICLSNVAKDLKMSKRTIYEIFNSKDEIFENIILRIIAKFKKNYNEIISKIKDNEMNVYDALGEFWKLIFIDRHLAHSKLFEKYPKYFEKFKSINKEFIDTLFVIAKKRKILKEDFKIKTFYYILSSIAHTIVMKYEMELENIVEINELLCYGMFQA